MSSFSNIDKQGLFLFYLLKLLVFPKQTGQQWAGPTWRFPGISLHNILLLVEILLSYLFVAKLVLKRSNKTQMYYYLSNLETRKWFTLEALLRWCSDSGHLVNTFAVSCPFANRDSCFSDLKTYSAGFYLQAWNRMQNTHVWSVGLDLLCMLCIFTGITNRPACFCS